MKQLILERTGGDPDGITSYFKLNPKVDDIPDKYAIGKNGIKVLSMGTIQRGGSGCACAINTFIRQLIRHLIMDRDEIVILDMEAGIEHLGRGTSGYVDCLCIITEPNITGLNTAKRIIKLSKHLNIPNIITIGNKIINKEDKQLIESCTGNMISEYIPFSGYIKQMSRVPEKPEQKEQDTAIAVKSIIDRLEILHQRK